MKRLKRGLALLLCLFLLVPAQAFAEENGTDGVGILDPNEIQAMLDAYIAEHSINPDRLSIGYVYTETGDTWYYNADKWYYSASMYKVPLMMILAEKEYNGELTRDSNLKGLTLGYAEEIILTYSHNDYAHLMMSVVADTEPDCREFYKNYADLPDDYYDPDFRAYSYFTARFMTQVMTTLYNDPERFPNVIDCLKNAQPEHYFRIHLGEYEIAQKYGSLNEWNHTTGIVYTPHPFILTVMTEYNPVSETTIAELAKLFADYTLQVDARLEAYEAQREAARLAAEEEARRLEEQRAAEEAAAAAQAEARVEIPAPAVTAETAPAAENWSQTVTEAAEASGENRADRLYVLIGATGVLLVAAVIQILRRSRG